MLTSSLTNIDDWGEIRKQVYDMRRRNEKENYVLTGIKRVYCKWIAFLQVIMFDENYL